MSFGFRTGIRDFVDINGCIRFQLYGNSGRRGMLLTLLSLPPDWDFTVEGMTKILPDGRDRII